jgi:hypothetical protein
MCAINANKWLELLLSMSEACRCKECSLKMACSYIYCKPTKVIKIYSFKLLSKCQKLRKGLSFITIHLS